MYFEAQPPEVMAGGSSLLRWETDNAASVRISGLGEVPASGSRSVSPEHSSTYVLTATNSRGRSVSADTKVTIMVYLQGTLPNPPTPPGGPRIRPPQLQPRPQVRPLREPRVLRAIALSAPVLLAPADGSTFRHYPRRTTVRWRPVGGAASYTVEVDCYQCCQTRRWCSDVGQRYKRAEGVRGTSYTFDFAGAQPGRVRVWAVDAQGRAGGRSPWRTFRYTR